MLALDEPSQDDQEFKEGKYSFIINKELLDEIKSVTIDFGYMGFSVDPGLPLSGGGGGCSGGSCSGCSGS